MTDEKVTVVDATPLGEPAWTLRRRLGSVEAAVRRRLEAVVLGGAAPDERTASLAALLHGAKLHRPAFPDAAARRAVAAVESVSQGRWSAAAVRHVVKAAEDALAVIVAVTAVTTVVRTV
ncbi:GPP34 family phosphoprotein [Streptomyces mutabilis]|uniref:GPP34 family phosphoprotein n=1 Tax=Streptomyces mutabilis TaxID=67332 RepID=UPI0035E8FC27